MSVNINSFFKWLVYYLIVMIVVCLIGGIISTIIDYILLRKYHSDISASNIGNMNAAITYAGMYFLYVHVSFIFLMPILFIYLIKEKKASLILLSFLGLFVGVILGLAIGDFFSFYIYPEKKYKNVVIFGIVLFIYPYVSSFIKKFTMPSTNRKRMNTSKPG